MRTIAIVGGGFSGTITAVNLARFAATPLRIVIINSGRPFGRGAAYGTRRLEHLLNVAARNMSAFPDHPGHFVEWLKGRGEFAEVPEAELRERFVPRRIYGDYLRSLVLGYQRPIDERCPVTLSVVDGEAVDIAISETGEPIVLLADGRAIDAQQVLLATGNQPPAPLPGPQGPFEHPGYFADPWGDWESSLKDPTADVVVLGAGLTTVDVFLSLAARGWTGSITAVSRHALFPKSHFRGVEYRDYLAERPDLVRLEDVARLVERHCRELAAAGQNGAIAVDKLRPHTQRLWQGFTPEEKRTFARRYSAPWNATRHRIAESIHRQLTSALEDGRLRLVAGGVQQLEAEGDRIVVRLRNAQDEESELRGDVVLNCTGPQTSFSTTRVPLFQNLLERGYVRPDDVDMGIEATEDFAVIDDGGDTSTWLFAIGPLLKGTLWETTAVPELRGQAMRVAHTLLDLAPTPAAHDVPVLEYCI